MQVLSHIPVSSQFQQESITIINSQEVNDVLVFCTSERIQFVEKCISKAANERVLFH